MLGLLWSFLNPLLMLAIYTLVFSSFLKLGSKPDVSTDYYSVFIFTGMVPWLAFSQALLNASRSVLGNSNLVKKSVFPIEVLPVVSVLSGFVHSLFAFGILLIVLIFLPGELIQPSLFWLPAVIVPQLLLTFGIAWFLASISVYVRDVREAVPIVLMAWWFATPILYPPSVIPDRFRIYMDLNPMKLVIDNYRLVILEGAPPDWSSLGVLLVLGLLAFFIGRAFFIRSKLGFADVL